MTSHASPLAELIGSQRDLIVARFVSDSVRKDLPPAGVAHRLVVDHIPRFLDELARQLTTRGADGSSTATGVAREHGEQRWELGYDLEGLIREYGVLRHCILQVAQERGAAPSLDDIDSLSRLLNDAIAAATAEYIRYRDQETNAQRTDLAFLAEAGELLSSSLDYRSTLAKLPALLVPRMADWCAVHLEGVSADEMPLLHVDPNKMDALRSLYRSYPLPLDSDRGYPSVLRSGKALRVSQVEDDYFDRTVMSVEQRKLVDDIHPQSWIIVPLTVHEQTFGAITLAYSDSAQRYGEKDLILANELARRVALALENARLYELSQVERSRAEAATRAKDELVAALSHELRTPLNAILGWVGLLADGMSEEKRAHAIAVIERNARAQRAIVDQLLDISAVMTGKLRIRLSQVDLSAVVDLAVEGFRAAADAKRLRLSVDLERDDALLRGDSERLYQVVTSLVSNAVKFSRKDGSVVVRLRRVESDFELTVSDDGEGIEPRVVPLLFETFRQADGSYARTHGGLGIGLSITKHLVELHGGTITAKSDGPGRGATFVVRIPVTAVASNTLPPAKAAARSMGTAPVTNNVAPAAGGMRVLVVDDDDGTRELVTTIFEAAGMVVRAAGSAEEARAALDAFDADVVLSDVGMPNEDGHALIRSLRTSPIAERRSLPAVALSAFARLEDRRRALAEGFNAYLLKPVEPQELVRTVTELGSTRALRRP